TADVVLLSSDQVKFWVHKNILDLSSEALAHIVCAGSVGHHIVNGVRLVQLEDNAKILDGLLRYCYPLDRPDVSDFSTMQALLDAALKYEMPHAAKSLRRALISEAFLNSHPLRVFATACRYLLHNEACIAAKATLQHDMISPEAPELKRINGLSYHRLLTFRQKCVQGALSLLSNFHWVLRDDWVWLQCQSCASASHTWRFAHAQGTYPVRKWWVGYIERASKALKEKPSPGVLTTQAILRECTREATQCRTCCEKAIWDLQEFSQLLAAQVKRKIDEVR
ncbi:hypothetical protein GLOTRDRAFT_26295, partial [Gloeophyllum trabeum ATCC 11539]